MDRTERVLQKLFDFQRFTGNKRLDRLIRDAEESEVGVLLDDSELELNAAGDADAWQLRKEDEEKP